MPQYIIFNRLLNLGVLLQKSPNIFFPLTQPFGTIGIPRSALVNKTILNAQIKQFTFLGDSGTIEYIKLSLPKGWSYLVFDYFDLDPVSIDFLFIFQGLNLSDIKTYRRIKLQSIAACCCLGIAITGHTNLHSDLIYKNHRGL